MLDKQKIRNYRLPAWEFKYKSYFKDVTYYVILLKKEILRIRNSKEYTEEEKIYIINKKIKPFFYERKEDIEYGYTLLKMREEY